jgi:hypothetical protein
MYCASFFVRTIVIVVSVITALMRYAELGPVVLIAAVAAAALEQPIPIAEHAATRATIVVRGRRSTTLMTEVLTCSRVWTSLTVAGRMASGAVAGSGPGRKRLHGKVADVVAAG